MTNTEDSLFKRFITMFDQSLTPDTCVSRGYQFIEDIKYDQEVLEGINNDIDHFEQEGYKIGEPSERKLRAQGLIGLYKAIH